MNSQLQAEWAQALGWMLLHSIWQVPIIWLLMQGVQRMLPLQNSNGKYAVGVSGLALAILVSVGTFLADVPGALSSSVGIEGGKENVIVGVSSNNVAIEVEWWSSVQTWFNLHLPSVLQIWFVGVLLLLGRLLLGGWQVHRLRSSAIPVNDHWTELTRELAARMDLTRVVRVAEAKIDAPLVMGYLKPIILLPIGLVSQLHPQQVETILLHELAHIRRHDFVVNLAQSVVEAVFFFNPFIWLISSSIRRERELCCDDRVVSMGYAPLLYARTLAQLEEERQAVPLALGLAGNKNQLLKRIKRIMEKSTQKESRSARLLPVVLIILTLVCTSWLSINRTPEGPTSATPATVAVKADTIGRRSYEKRSVTYVDAQGVPHEETIEIFDGVDSIEWVGFAAPLPSPSIPGFPDMPDFGDPAAAPFLPGDAFSFSDSLPDGPFFHGDRQQWDAFEKDFKQRLERQFGDFYSKNGEQIEKLMEEARQSALADEAQWQRAFGEDLKRLQESLALTAPQTGAFEGAFPDRHQLEMDMARQEKDMQRFQEDMQRQQKDMQRMEMEMQRQEQSMREWESKSRQFEKELKELLLADGYLKKGESIRNLEVKADGAITINGEAIKSKDLPKYRDLHQQYFKKGDIFVYQE